MTGGQKHTHTYQHNQPYTLKTYRNNHKRVGMCINWPILVSPILFMRTQNWSKNQKPSNSYFLTRILGSSPLLGLKKHKNGIMLC